MNFLIRTLVFAFCLLCLTPVFANHRMSGSYTVSMKGIPVKFCVVGGSRQVTVSPTLASPLSDQLPTPLVWHLSSLADKGISFFYTLQGRRLTYVYVNHQTGVRTKFSYQLNNHVYAGALHLLQQIVPGSHSLPTSQLMFDPLQEDILHFHAAFLNGVTAAHPLTVFADNSSNQIVTWPTSGGLENPGDGGLQVQLSSHQESLSFQFSGNETIITDGSIMAVMGSGEIITLTPDINTTHQSPLPLAQELPGTFDITLIKTPMAMLQK